MLPSIRRCQWRLEGSNSVNRPERAHRYVVNTGPRASCVHVNSLAGIENLQMTLGRLVGQSAHLPWNQMSRCEPDSALVEETEEVDKPGKERSDPGWDRAQVTLPAFGSS